MSFQLALRAAVVAIVLVLAGLVYRQAGIIAGKETQLRQITDAAAIVTGNPKLKREDVTGQLYLFGNTVDQLRKGMAACSNATDALGDQTRLEQDALAIERKRAAQRVEAIDRTVEALEASARSTAVLGACLSPELERRWRQ